MNKIFLLIIFLIFIEYSFPLKEAKEILIEFLKVTKNDKIIDNISEKCLGATFDYHFLLMQKNIIENNIEKTSKYLENMGLDILVNCPFNELFEIFTETEYEIFSPLALKYKYKIYLKLLSLGSSLYLQYNNRTLTPKYIGGILGKIVNLCKFDYEALYELETDLDEDDNSSKDIDLIIDNINNHLTELFSGIFRGMKKADDGMGSLCYKDILKNKNKLWTIVESAIKKMREGESLSQAIKSLGFKLVTIEGITVDCNLLNLGNSVLSKITSMKEFIKFFNKIFQNSQLYIEIIEQIITNFKNKKIKEAGIYLGKIISSIIGFNVN